MKKKKTVIAATVSLAAISLGAAIYSSNSVQSFPAAEQSVLEITVYKSPTCGCCTKWEEHLRQNGFRVVSKETTDLDQVKLKHRVPRELGSCHTGVIAGYAIEGHVPAASIRRLLKERPKGVLGLAVPGMPMGSPGMEGPESVRYEVLALREESPGRPEVFDRY